MAYTKDQLVTAYTNANLGKGPDLATTLTLDAYATQSQTGGITDAVALTNALKLVNSTTAVAIEAYQFFTNRAPSAAGLAYLVNSTTNTNDLNDAYFAKFSQENRFINFSINLATGTGEGAAAFKAAYGDTATATVTYAQAVATAYDKIIGNAVATAAGVDVAGAVAYLTRQANIDYLTAFVKANTSYTADADINLAVKAALIGEVLNVATVAGLGGYANATAAMINDLSDGTLSTDNAAGVNLLTAYPGAGAVGQTYTLSAGIDTVPGTAGNDIIVGNTTAGVMGLTSLDTIDGGAGNDTLTLAVLGNVDTTTAVGTSIKNVETVNIVSTGAVTADSTGWTGTTALNVTGALGAVAATAASTTAVKVVAAPGAGAISVQGASSVDVTASGTTGGAINIGNTTAASGNITVSTAVAAAAAGGAVSATTKGGTSISLTQTKGAAATGGALNATDGAAAAGKLGTVTTVKLDGYNGGSVTSNALTALTLANGAGTVAVTNNFGTGNATNTLALTLNAAGGTLNDVAGVYSTINVTTTGKASTLTITDTALKTLSTAGDQALTLGTVPATVTAYTGSGTGSVSGTFGAALKTYASSATGGDTVTLNPTALVSASFGSGKDTVTLAGVGASTTINLGAGDDKLVFTAAPTAGTTLAGGDGNDTFSVTDAIWTTIAGTFVAADVAKITGFETLAISDSGTAGTKTYNLGVLPGLANVSLETGVQNGATATISNLTSGQTITVGGNTTNGVVAAVVGGAATGTADVVNVVANTNITQNNDAVVNTSLATVTLTATDVETVNFKSTGTLSTAVTTGNATDIAFNTLSINASDTALKTVTLTGDQSVSFTSNAAFTKLATVDASGLTGVAAPAIKEVFKGTFAATVDADTITFDGVAFVATAGQTNVQNAGTFVTFYNGQAAAHWVAVDNGDGTVTFTSKTGGVVTDVASSDFVVASGGAGADTSVTAAAPTIQGVNAIQAGATIDISSAAVTSAAISVKGTAGIDTITVSNNALVTGNGGNDTFVIVTSGNGNSYSTILDANKGDVVKTAGAATFATAGITLAGTAVFQDYLDAATTGNASHKVSWFVYGGDTYLVEDVNAGATFQNGSDIVVKLTGTTNDLTKATFDGAAHTLTLG